MPERNCDECHEKIAAVTQRVGRVESDVRHIQELATKRDEEFHESVQKEEKAFDTFYTELRKHGEKQSAIVMKGMEDRADLKDLIERKYVTKESIRLSWLVASVVGGGMLALSLWFFTNVTTAKQGEQITVMMQQLTEEIRTLTKVP